MIRNILTALILLPIAAAIVLFAVGNRAPVAVGFDPFAANPPMFTFAMPLFLLLAAGAHCRGYSGRRVGLDAAEPLAPARAAPRRRPEGHARRSREAAPPG